MSLTAQQTRELISAAANARRRAYAPYSKFCVGAALLSADGRVFTGANVENSSYGLSICAERVAVVRAVAEGCRKFVAIAIVAPGAATPCGACRQVLAEFGDCQVLCANPRGRRPDRETRISALLPAAFHL